MKLAVFISGRGSNLQAILEAAAAGLAIVPCAVFSDRPDAFALERARRAGIESVVVDYAGGARRRRIAETELGRRLTALDPDLVVLAGFMRVLPTALVQRFAGRMLNVHPSLLPRHRGLDTYRRALAAGDRQHGSTVHFVVPELDAGPSILQFRLAIHPGDTEQSLRERVQRGEHVIYPRAIGWFADGRLELQDGAAWLDGRPLTGPVIVDEAADDRG